MRKAIRSEKAGATQNIVSPLIVGTHAAGVYLHAYTGSAALRIAHELSEQPIEVPHNAKHPKHPDLETHINLAGIDHFRRGLQGRLSCLGTRWAGQRGDNDQCRGRGPN
jgi:hypothetical protein